MTNDTPTGEVQPSDSTPEPSPSVFEDVPEYDGLLELLVRVLNDSPDGAIGMTFSVNGAVVSGVAIGRDDWMRKLSETHAHHPVGQLISQLAEKFTLSAIAAERDDFAEWFVHLERASYMGGFTRTPSEGGIFVRLRLSEIDSWSFAYFGDVLDGEDATPSE